MEKIKTLPDHFNELASIVNDISTSKGWVIKIPGKSIALIHSEISEALEALRAGNKADDKIPEFKNIEIELADAIIRIMHLDFVMEYKTGSALENELPVLPSFKDFETTFNYIQEGAYRNIKVKDPADKIAQIHLAISRAYITISNGLGDVGKRFAVVIMEIMCLAESEGYRVGDAIVAKVKYNKTRPYKHGGKLF